MYKEEDYVEYKPVRGKSSNVRIVEVLGDNKYVVMYKGKLITISEDRILGKNLW